MKKLVLLGILLFLLPVVRAEAVNDSLLRVLDKMLDNRNVYERQKLVRLSQLEKKLENSGTDSLKFIVLGELFQEYRSFRIDRAMFTAEQRKTTALSLNRDARAEAAMNEADVLNKIGKPYEALEVLDEIGRNDFTAGNSYFYYLYHTTYLSLLGEELNPKRRHIYHEKIAHYKDTLIRISREGTPGYFINLSGKLRHEGETARALEILSDCYNNLTELGDASRGQLEFSLYGLYLELGDTTRAVHHLTLAAIDDIGNAKKVYMSLQRLAMLLFQQGDVPRAYKYISCALEDITEGKARYRVFDIADYFPIISAANDERIVQNRRRIWGLVSVISLLSVVLVGAVWHIRKRNIKLQQVQQSLQERNDRLQKMAASLKAMNDKIRESNHIKEEYIGLLFNICSEYIGKQESLRKKLLNIVSTGQLADVARLLHGQTSANEDFKAFVYQFDSIFLHLFPHFVEAFNTLLRPEERIQLKSGELLTPELRIYALIKLGIEDNTKIAAFLHYSLQTVYNYRQKMRNKAELSKKDLVKWVQGI